jgi:dUTP pyrophosphatase
MKEYVTNNCRGFEKVGEKEWGLNYRDDNIFYEEIKLPKRATRYSAGYDIFATQNVILIPGKEVLMPLGFKVFMMEDEFFAILPRSGMGFKYYIRLANTIGIVDADYYNNSKNEGHCWLKIRNESENQTLTINQGEAVAQGIFMKYLLAIGDSFEEGNLREGGLGSTNI